MALNQTPAAQRIHIGFFGRRNAGKSSLLNAVTGQELAVVSEVKGTTTDPVYKTMELLPLGPVMLVDTPGIDDEGELGELRIKKSRQVLNKTDIAVLVIDGTVGETPEDREMIRLFTEKKVPFVVVYNKADLLPEGKDVPWRTDRSEESARPEGTAPSEPGAGQPGRDGTAGPLPLSGRICQLQHPGRDRGAEKLSRGYGPGQGGEGPLRGSGGAGGPGGLSDPDR